MYNISPNAFTAKILSLILLCAANGVINDDDEHTPSLIPVSALHGGPGKLVNVTCHPSEYYATC